ncbi:ectoine/hydroxyectoine ABC transporter substrate-binding protein EhuB [Neobacillus cucumis]|uniref:Ectoine/hydroxyectoine ABC transporter substrate-binding protein EhuB n=1 Tax=Neobacillus cucumis TaxID=1740721 RepID=A0A2N5HA42_9BACI|nr:ectoine/hydroxyectoine ABC transporter substrate-binding protein EhuB [Neobacillus cucumis]PLS02375.1 ectoine/hydroxyectoine ABC transporter substrate-binding protein EhuB [Neobacillus cucumis]
MKKWIMSILVGVMLVVLAGCGTSKSTSAGGSVSGETTLEKMKKQGYATVGFANEIPYAYATSDGKLTGESVEVARAVLKRLGIKEVNGVLTEFGSLIPGLKAKRFDIITAGMYITPERAKEVAYGNPDYMIGQAIAVKKGNPYNLHSYEDIAKNKKVKVGVIGGSVESGYLTAVGVSNEQISIFPDNSSLISALQSKRVDTVTVSGPSIRKMLESANDPNLESVNDFVQPVIDGKSFRAYGAIVFRQGDDEFRKAYNKELQALKDSGELLKILKKFGMSEDELPKDVTVEDVLK